MENIEYIYDTETQAIIDALNTELVNLKEIYLPLINNPTIGDTKQESLFREYLNKTTTVSTAIVEILNEHKPIALIVNGKVFKYKTIK